MKQMESSTRLDAKRARKSTHVHQSFSHKREVDATKQQKEEQQQQQEYSSSSSSSSPRESAIADSAVVAERRSMTARPDGAAVEGEEDAIFDEPMVGEELKGLMGETPSAGNESAHFIADTAARLAIESGCVDEAPLVLRGRITRRRNVRPTPVSYPRKVDLQRVLDRQTKRDGAPGYLLAKG
ncbi:unnamed protein product [Pylaiella littoralis]